MFSALRQNNIVYILDKKDSPMLKKGQVISVTAPRSKTNGVYSNPLDTVVDMELKVEESSELFKNIPSNQSIVNDGNVVISETREAMCTEVESMLASSKQILESIPYHEKVVASCDDILKELNPQFAKEKLQEEKINNLENKMSGMENTLSNIQDMLSKALNKQP